MLKKVVLLIMIILVIFQTKFVYAATAGESNANINSSIIIEDDADLLTEIEEKELKNQMAALTEYGIVLLKTTNTVNGSNSERYIRNYYYSKFGNKKGVAFYIDMKNRQLCACATGGLEKIITSGKCDTIMDNVYRYASKGNYYQCAIETYSQMNQLLSGGKIAESMKYICNAILAVMISLFSSFGLFKLISGNRKASNKDMINECVVSLQHTPIVANKTGSHREYSPVSDSSSSGGGGGFSGGGGGGRRIFWK